MSHTPIRRSSGQDLSPLLRICHAVYRLLRVLTLSNSRNLQGNGRETKNVSYIKHLNIIMNICVFIARFLQDIVLIVTFILMNQTYQHSVIIISAMMQKVVPARCNETTSLTCTVWTCGDWMTDG